MVGQWGSLERICKQNDIFVASIPKAQVLSLSRSAFAGTGWPLKGCVRHKELPSVQVACNLEIGAAPALLAVGPAGFPLVISGFLGFRPMLTADRGEPTKAEFHKSCSSGYNDAVMETAKLPWSLSSQAAQSKALEVVSFGHPFFSSMQHLSHRLKGSPMTRCILNLTGPDSF